MKKKILVSYIKSPSKWGEMLFQQSKALFEHFVPEQENKSGNAQYEFEVTDVVDEMIKTGKFSSLSDCQMCSFSACLYSDTVIFDGSIEDGIFDQYQFAYDLMKHLDHVLIISRTELPYNFEGQRKGGAPSWIKIGGDLNELDSVTDPEQANAHILEWLGYTLERLELPRSNKPKEAPSITNCLEIITQMMEESDKHMEALEGPSLFISYLSKDYKILKDHFQEIEEHTGVLKESFHYFAPGKVATEFMTEQRRWEIVSITDREIHKCTSILIFQTDGYYCSWWTMGELISISYRFHECWDKCPTVYIAKAHRNSKGIYEFTWKALNTPEEKQEFFPGISEGQKRRLARRFANSDPNEAAYELDEKTTRQSGWPFVVKAPVSVIKGTAIYLAQKNNLFGKMLGNDTLAENISHAWESANSYTHTKAFRTKRIVECKYCRENASHLTVDNFIQMDMPYVYHVDDEELSERKDGTLQLVPKCPIHGNIRLKKNGQYYRFIQPRYGKKMKAGKTLIEFIDRIEFCDIER